MTRRDFLKASIIAAAGLAAGSAYYVRRPEFGTLPAGSRLARIQASPHYYGGQFQCLEPVAATTKGSKWGAMASFLLDNPPRVRPAVPVVTAKTDISALPVQEDIAVWLGHSSFYLQLQGYRMLMDPVFSSFASPVFFVNKAFPGSNVYTADDFPAIDVLVLSHDHWDHLDYPSVKALLPKVKHVVCPLGVGAYLEQWGLPLHKLHEDDWYSTIPIAPDLAVHILPGQHFSGRLLTQNQTEWAGFAFITPKRRVFYSGDGGYGRHFADIGFTFGPFDLALMEDGQYNENWSRIHMMPEEAAQAGEDVRAKAVIPMHNGKFALSKHPWDEPYIRLTAASAGKSYRLLTPRIGEAVYIGRENQTFAKWWEQMK